MADKIRINTTQELLEKIAGDAFDIYNQGKAKTERKIAARHGVHLENKGFLHNYSEDSAAGLRASGKGMLTGTIGVLATGAGASKLAQRAVRRGATTMARANTFTRGMVAIGGAGAYAGGLASSFKNQAKEINDKYRTKTASDILEKVAFINAGIGALASTDGHRWGGAAAGMIGSIPGTVAGSVLGPAGMLGGHILGSALGGHLYGKYASKNDSEVREKALAAKQQERREMEEYFKEHFKN